MHFFYLDETGCNGRDLTQAEQPVFVLGGIIVRDEGWNKTHVEFENIISEYFDGNPPENFELHTQDLFSPEGSGSFAGHTRENRNQLIHNLLDLIATRKHHFCFFAVDKMKLDAFDTDRVTNKGYLDLKVPYLVAYDYLISTYEKHTKDKLGRSARALVIIDEKDSLIEEIESITHYRRFEIQKSKRVKWLTEFSYPVNSKKNLMIQFSDLFLFLTRKYLEIEAGYKEGYSTDLKNIFRDFYKKVDARLIPNSKSVNSEPGKINDQYNEFIVNISVYPTRQWKSKTYN